MPEVTRLRNLLSGFVTTLKRLFEYVNGNLILSPIVYNNSYRKPVSIVEHAPMVHPWLGVYVYISKVVNTNFLQEEYSNPRDL